MMAIMPRVCAFDCSTSCIHCGDALPCATSPMVSFAPGGPICSCAGIIPGRPGPTAWTWMGVFACGLMLVTLRLLACQFCIKTVG